MLRICDEIKRVELSAPKSQAAGTYYNGAADASGLGVDMKDYDEAMIVLETATVPSNGTLDVSLYEADANTGNASAASAITGAAFTQVTASNDEGGQVAQVKIRLQKQYLFAKAVVANQTIPFSVTAYVKGNSFPVSQTEVFDV